MATVILTKGQVALIDDQDLALVSEFSWSAKPNGRTFYARASTPHRGGKQFTIYMHRFIIGASDGVQVDHRNGNGLDNRRANLRFASRSQNIANMQKALFSKSRFKGVTWRKRDRIWVARVKLLGTRFYLGSFKREEDAAAAYDLKAKELFGEFARLNFPVSQT